jgi:S1-C subfamily serine protease
VTETDETPDTDLAATDTFRPEARRRKAVAATVAVVVLTLVAVAALSRVALAPRLLPDPPAETPRDEQILEKILPPTPAPARLRVTTALPEGIAAGAKMVARQTVVVENEYGNRGSGFMLRPGVLVTAAHIADKADRESKKLKVRCEPVETDADILLIDPLRDVLVARVDCVASPLKIDGGAYRDGAGLFFSGFNFVDDTAARYFTPTAALPDATFAPNDERITRQLEKAARHGAAPLQGFASVVIPGNSGSPVFTSEGVVVGMVVMIDGANGRSFMVPAANLRAALKAAGIKE